MDFKTLFLSPEGRINRKPYWMGLLVLMGTSFVIQILAGVAQSPAIGYLSIVILVPAVMMAIKRLHDRGRSGWFYLLMIIPLVNIWIAIEILFLAGTPGPNRYGPDPLNQLIAPPYPA